MLSVTYTGSFFLPSNNLEGWWHFTWKEPGMSSVQYFLCEKLGVISSLIWFSPWLWALYLKNEPQYLDSREYSLNLNVRKKLYKQLLRLYPLILKSSMNIFKPATNSWRSHRKPYCMPYIWWTLSFLHQKIEDCQYPQVPSGAFCPQWRHPKRE